MAYPNLPGVTVTLNDLGLQIAPPPVGSKVTLLGVTSNTDIPLREAFTVSNLGAAVAALWVSGASGEIYPGELALAVEEAAQAGATNIEVVVIDHVTGDALEALWLPTGTGPAARYSALALTYDAIKDRPLDVVVPVNAWANCPAVSGKFTEQLAQFSFSATREVDNACIGVIPAMPVVHWALAFANAAANPLTGHATVGTEVTSITHSDLHFGSPSQALVAYWEKHLTDTTGAGDNLPALSGQSWIDYLAGSESETGAFENYTDPENTAQSVNPIFWDSFQGKDLEGNLVTDQRGNKADAGTRISVVAAPLVTRYVSTPKFALHFGAPLSTTLQNTDGAASYAALISQLIPQSAPTNKSLNSIASQRRLSSAQANRLGGRRIVTFLDRTIGFVVANAITGGHFVSKFVRTDFTRLTTVRITDAVIQTVKQVGERFIGEPNTATARNALSAEIDKGLREIKAAGAITSYRFEITATPDQQVLGEAQIDLSIVPVFELIRININVSLTKQ